MKHLRKILLALVVVAMLASTIATIAFAADPVYKGNLETAQTLLDAAANSKTVSDQSAALAKVYIYLTDASTKVDPATDGYKKFRDSYNDLTVKCGMKLYDEVYKKDSKGNLPASLKSSESLAKVYVHFAAAPVIDGQDPTVSREDVYACAFCGAHHALTADELKAGALTAGFECSDKTCAGKADNYAPYTVKYSDFVKIYQGASLDITEALIDILYKTITFTTVEVSKTKYPTALTTVGYYDYVAIQKVLRDYLAKAPALDYVAPENAKFTGSITDVEALLATVKENSALEEKKTVAADIYKYLIATPVDPTTDRYGNFFEAYYDLAESIMDEMFATVDDATDTHAKIAALVTVKTYLAANPINESFVTSFNSKVAALKSDYLDASEKLESDSLIIDKATLVTPKEYTGSIDAFNALVGAIDATASLGVRVENVKAMYDYIVTTPIDPASLGYADAIALYVAERDAVINAMFATVDEVESPADKPMALKDIFDVLTATPLSDAAIDRYNSGVVALKKVCDDAVDVLDSDEMKIEDFVFVEKETNVSVEMLDIFVSDIENAPTIDAKKVAVSTIYKYLTTAVINEVTPEIQTVFARYDAAKTEFTNALIAAVDTAEGTDAKIAKMNEIRAYIIATPYAKSAFTAYNAKVDEIVAEADRAGMKANYFILELEAVVAAINEFEASEKKLGEKAEAQLDELKKAYAIFISNNFDASDGGTQEAKQNFGVAYQTVISNVSSYIDSVLNPTERCEALASFRDFVVSYPFSPIQNNVYNTLINNTIFDYTEVSESLAKEEIVIVSAIDTLLSKIDDVNEAQTLTEKIEAFKTLYSAYKNSVVDPTDSAAFDTVYGALCTSLTEALVASVGVGSPSEKIEALAVMADLIKTAPYSEAVIDAYITAYNDAKEAPYGEVVAEIQNALQEGLAYVAPTGVSNNFDGANITDKTAETKEYLKAYYDFLAAEPLNVGAAKYPGVIAQYKESKDAVKKAFVEDVDSVVAEILASIPEKSLTDSKLENMSALLYAMYNGKLADIANSHISKLAEMYNYLSKTAVSYELVNAYNEKRDEILYANNSYSDIHESARSLYSEDLANLHTHLANCKLGEDVPADVKARIDTICDGFEYAELVGYTVSYETLMKIAEIPTVTGKALLNKINSYLLRFSLSSDYVAYESFLQLYYDACEDYVATALAEVDTLATVSEKISELNSIKSDIETLPATVKVAKLFNDKIKAIATEYGSVAEALLGELALVAKGDNGLIVDTEYATDAVAKLNELLGAITSAQTLDEKKLAFTNIYNYITSVCIDTTTAEYAAFLTAYSTARNDFRAALFATVNDDNAPTLEAKIAALLVLRDYLNVTPVDQDTVDKYNDKVDEIINDCKDGIEFAKGIKAEFTPIPPVSGRYNGHIGTMTAYESSINIDVNATDFSTIDYATVIAQIKKYHDYVRNPDTLVKPNEDYYNSLNSYNAKCDKLTELLMDDYKKAETIDAKKIALEVVYGYVKDCIYSEQLVNELNAAALEIGAGYEAIKQTVSAPDVKVISPFGNLTNLIKAIDSQLPINKLKRAFAEFFAYYKTLILDVTDPSYADFLKAFEDKEKVFKEALLKAVDDANNPLEKYTMLIAAKDCIIENPVSVALIDSYNAKLVEVKALKYDLDKQKLEAEVAAFVYYTGDAAGLSEILAQITENSTTEDKKATLKAAYEYISTKRIDASAEGYATTIETYQAACDALVAELIKSITDAADNDAKVVALKSVREYLAGALFSAEAVDAFNEALRAVETNEVEPLVYYNLTLEELINTFSGIRTDGADTVKEVLANVYKLITEKRIDAKKDNKNVITDVRTKMNAEVAVLIQAAKDRLDANAPISEYDAPTVFNYNFNDGGKLPWTLIHTSEYNNANPANPDCYRKNENGHMAIYLNKVIASRPYFEFKIPSSEKGFVFEFDISVHAADKVTDEIAFGCIEGTGDERATANFLKVKNNDIINGAGLTVIKDAIARGEWTHVALVYIPESFSMKLYVDYEFISEYKLKYNKDVSHKVTVLRVQLGGSGQYVSFDNMLLYQGTDCRTVDMFKNMSDAEKFNYYVDYFQNPERTSVNRNSAYRFAKSLLSSVLTEPSCKANIAILNSYDYNGNILGATREENLKALVKLVDEIGEISIKNTAEKINLIQNIETFISTNAQFLPQADERFIEIRENITEKTEIITEFNNTKQLLAAFERFKRATTLASMTRHSASVASYYELCGFVAKDKDGKWFVTDKYDVIKNDVSVKEFLAEVGEETLMDYYDSMPDIIAERIRIENSDRIIDCILFIENIEGYDADASYEDKKAFWDENYDYINKYILVIRGVIKNYDNTVEGVEEALKVYDEINKYFFDRLQKEHVRVMQEQLDKYPLTDSYIEKKGICSFIEKYLKDNDIDETLDEIKAIKATYLIYSEEVEIHKSEYQALLDQNTVSFISVVDRMKANENSYAALVALFNEANEKYYYSMNVDTEDAELKTKLELAILAFEQYALEIQEIELASENFLKAAKTLENAKNRTQKYKALINCAKYEANANADVDGVSEAIELYNTALAAYKASVTPANEIVSEANEAVCSVRTISIADTVLSVIKNMFSK